MFLDTNQIILGKGGGEQKRMVQMYIDTCTCNFSSFIGDGVGWDTLYFFALQWFKKPIATCNIPLNRKTYVCLIQLNMMLSDDEDKGNLLSGFVKFLQNLDT